MNGDFVGVASLKRQQAEQVLEFESWAAHGEWDSFHRSHYDWWAFPVDAPSQHGFTYALTPDAIETLRHDQDFLASLRRAAVLLLMSWGRDARTGKDVEYPTPAQVWQNWPIRLYKCARSLEIFEQWDLFNVARDYALELIDQGHSFHWNGRDLADYFRAPAA